MYVLCAHILDAHVLDAHMLLMYWMLMYQNSAHVLRSSYASHERSNEVVLTLQGVVGLTLQGVVGSCPR